MKIASKERKNLFFLFLTRRQRKEANLFVDAIQMNNWHWQKQLSLLQDLWLDQSESESQSA